MGYSVGSDDDDNKSVQNDQRRVVVSEHPSVKTQLRDEDQRGPGLLQDLIDDVMQSNRRSELLESQTVIANGPIGDKVMEQEEETMHSYAAKKKFDCPKFQHDLYEVCTPCQDVCRLFDCNDGHSKPRLPALRCIGDPYKRFIRNSEIALLKRNYFQFAESFKVRPPVYLLILSKHQPERIQSMIAKLKYPPEHDLRHLRKGILSQSSQSVFPPFPSLILG